MGHCKEVEVGFINIFLVRIRLNEVQTIFVGILDGGTNIGPYWFHPHPHPHPWRQQKSPARDHKK